MTAYRSIRLSFLLATFLVLPHLHAYASTLHVPGDYPTIRAAVDAAHPGDIVMIACGTYLERNIPLRQGVVVRSESGLPDCVTIDAQSLGRVFIADGVVNAKVRGLTVTGGSVLAPYPQAFGGGVWCRNAGLRMTDCVLRGNRVTEDNGEDGSFGGALACSTSVVELVRCAILDNGAYAEGGYLEGLGGGVFAYRSTLTMTDCELRGNESGYGGGVNLSRTSLTMSGCTIADNTGLDGGGMSVWNSPMTLTECEFEDNHGGAGLYVSFLEAGDEVTLTRCAFTGNNAAGFAGIWASPLFRDCTFVENVGSAAVLLDDADALFEQCVFWRNHSAFGGAVCNYTSRATLRGCTMVENTATSGGSGIYTWDGNTYLESCIIAFGEGSAALGHGEFGRNDRSCCDVYGNPGDGTATGSSVADDPLGNFSADPLFCDLEGGDFHLQETSPCAPGHHPEGAECGLIGALEVGCGATRASPATWGSVKVRFEE
jgi:hypothetical protein